MFVSVRLALVIVLTTFCCLVESQHPASVTINGEWSPWSRLETDCLKLNETSGLPEDPPRVVTCGGGIKVKTRSCTNPKPQGLRAKQCAGASTQNFPCNDQPCDTTWGPFSKCNAECGRGTQESITLCEDVNGDWAPCTEKFPKHAFTWTMGCNTWNKTTCTSPCVGYSCPTSSICKDLSTDFDPRMTCECQLGTIKDTKTGLCVIPLPQAPTPRPDPTLAPAVKTATTVATKSASSLLVILVTITLAIFLIFRIFDSARFIQMNMEIALVCAHLCMLPPNMTDHLEICRLISILIHFFFTACFMFMFLEALHVWALMGNIVKKNGMFSKFQNFLVGWGIAAAIVLVTVGLQYENYGGNYHCWLRMDTSLQYAQLFPICGLVILTFALLEAAGGANYVDLPFLKDPEARAQLTSAKIMQKTNVIIMPLVLATFILGAYGEYEQDIVLYGLFTTFNGVLGGCVLAFHVSANMKVRALVMNALRFS